MENKRDPIPEFETLEEMAEFWDTHSTADYEDLTHPVDFVVQLNSAERTVRLMPELSAALELLAKSRGVSVETLINVWLKEKVIDLT